MHEQYKVCSVVEVVRIELTCCPDPKSGGSPLAHTSMELSPRFELRKVDYKSTVLPLKTMKAYQRHHDITCL